MKAPGTSSLEERSGRTIFFWRAGMKLLYDELKDSLEVVEQCKPSVCEWVLWTSDRNLPISPVLCHILSNTNAMSCQVLQAGFSSDSGLQPVELFRCPSQQRGGNYHMRCRFYVCREWLRYPVGSRCVKRSGLQYGHDHQCFGLADFSPFWDWIWFELVIVNCLKSNFYFVTYLMLNISGRLSRT